MNQAIIFDTSVWIELIKQKNIEKSLLFYEYILSNKPLWLTPTIVQEVLQGSKNLKV
jgi:predicted nucleic acid-binding protein